MSALLLNVGGLAALSFTPLYGMSETHDGLHGAIHAHFLAAGYLFARLIVGQDPVPGRLSVPGRLVVLGVSIAAHASVAQLLYAGLGVQVNEPASELCAAGDLMYFGGDIAEVLMALALLLTWTPHAPTTSP